MTWNCAGVEPTGPSDLRDLQGKLIPLHDPENTTAGTYSDIYVIGLQELVELNASQPMQKNNK